MLFRASITLYRTAKPFLLCVPCLNNFRFISYNLIIEEIRSIFFGRCYKIEFLKPQRRMEAIYIPLKNANDYKGICLDVSGLVRSLISFYTYFNYLKNKTCWYYNTLVKHVSDRAVLAASQQYPHRWMINLKLALHHSTWRMQLKKCKQN